MAQVEDKMQPSDELPAVNQTGQGRMPTAMVFTDAIPRRMTPAEAKRNRFVRGLKNNYARLNEAMAVFEYFAEICELSMECREGIRKANKAAITELSDRLEKKLAEYDKRNKESI